jgi:FkbM family methyltransferase
MKLSILKKILPYQISIYLEQLRGTYNLKKIKKEEEKSIEFLARKKFYQQIIKKGDTYFDIGANYGNRIGPILKIGAKKVVAIEPQGVCCDHLKKIYPKIIVLQNGLGAEKAVKEFYISDQSVLSTFSQEFINSTQSKRFKGIEWREKQMIEIIRLDDLIIKYGMPDFIKIDVEGYELEVVNGLSKKVKMLSFEYTTPELAHKLEPILMKLKALGEYKFNYSKGESMQFELIDWMDSDAGIKFIKTSVFLQTGFGDIYINFI